MSIQVTTGPAILSLVVLTMDASAGCRAQSMQNIALKPGQQIQEIVEDSPEGTRFVLEPGIYRQQTIYPKSGQEFIGQEGVILSGAMELRSWKREGDVWSMEGLPPPLHSHGHCVRDLCGLREDLFFNGQLYERVGSLADLDAGAWYYEDGRAYLSDDPTGQAVELSVTPLAFGGDAADVLLQDFVVEKYASEAQSGAIDLRHGRGWVVTNVTARWNHGVGLHIGPGAHVKGGSFSHNGQLGVRGTGDDAIVEHVEIGFNNYAGFDGGWEAGGTKFLEMNKLVVRDSCIHNNGGPGLWTDFENTGVLYERNVVFLNAGDGIKHEISHNAIIRHNTVAHNGFGWDNWLWGSQILVQNSYGVHVHDNHVEISADRFGNGIGIIHQDRGPWQAMRNVIDHNTIVHLGDRGLNGIVKDVAGDSFWRDSNNRFDWNKYIVVDPNNRHWAFFDHQMDWREVQELGYERNGELIVEQRTPKQLSCRGLE